VTTAESAPPNTVDAGPAIDVSQFDPDIRAQDDLFRHVNGPWLRSTDIPADRATAGAFMTLFDEAEKKVRSILEACLDAPEDRGEERQIGDLYASFMGPASSARSRRSPTSRRSCARSAPSSGPA
jgi:putative endopeptidase